jgi:hypothetical protein
VNAERTKSRSQPITLVDALDRLLEVGVVAAGDLTLSVAGVDLIYVNLRALLSSVETIERTAAPPLRAPEESSNRQAIAGQVSTAMPGEPHPSSDDPGASSEEPFEGVAHGGDHEVRLPDDGEDLDRGLAGLIVVVIDLLRQLLERQAIRRMEGGSLTDDQVERLGRAFLRLERRVEELKRVFGLDRDAELPDMGSLLDLGRNGPRQRRLPGPFSGDD